MYAATSLASAYHKLKDSPENKDYLLAFGVGQFFEFLKSDAHRIHEALLDSSLSHDS